LCYRGGHIRIGVGGKAEKMSNLHNIPRSLSGQPRLPKSRGGGCWIALDPKAISSYEEVLPGRGAEHEANRLPGGAGDDRFDGRLR